MTNILEDDTASSSKYIHNVYLNFAAKYKEHIGKSHFFFFFYHNWSYQYFFFLIDGCSTNYISHPEFWVGCGFQLMC